MCVEGICICPAGYTASPTTARCEPNPTTSPPSTGDYREGYASSVLTAHISSVMQPHTRPPYRPTAGTRPPFNVATDVLLQIPKEEIVWTTSPWPPPVEISTQTTSTFPATKPWHVLTTASNVANIDRFVDFKKLTTIERPKTTQTMDECTAVGLYCRGGTVCINMSCQCPPGFVLHNDQCVPPPTSVKRKSKGYMQGELVVLQNEPYIWRSYW